MNRLVSRIFASPIIRTLSQIMVAFVVFDSVVTVPITANANTLQLAQASQRTAHLDALFADLKAAPNEGVAQLVEQQIWLTWSKPDDADLRAGMADVFKARSSYNYDKALQILDGIIARWPNYSEAWNQRATVYFLKQDYEQSLIAIAETLRLEPRHFGALAGRAVIRMRQSKPALALQNIKHAMTYHPYLRERYMFPSLLK